MQWRVTSIIPAYFRLNHSVIRTAVTLSFKVVGESILYPDKPPILIFHGLFESKKNWESIGKTIQSMTKRAVFAVDMRNHGDSPQANSHRYKDLAEDILHTVKVLDLKRVTLVGHSVGGRACMYTALMAPQLVSSLVVVDISPVSSCRVFLERYPVIMDAMKAVDFDKIPKKTVRAAKRYAENQLISVIPDHSYRETLISNIKIKKNGLIGWSCNLDVLIKEFKHLAWFPKSKGRRYEGPTLFIGGQLSDFIPPDDLSGIRDIFPRSLVTYVKDAKHNVHIDDPRTFLERVIAFIKDHHV